MKRTMILLAFLGAANAALAAPADDRRAGSIDSGRFLVLRSCAGCHAVGETGKSPDSHAPPFPVVRGSVTSGQLTMMLSELSKNGHAEMPPIFMSEAEIRDISAYVANLRPSTGRPHSPRRTRKIGFVTGPSRGSASRFPGARA